MRVLVTGANGFVGTHLIEKLAKNPENEIIAAVNSHTVLNPKWINNHSIHSVTFDLRDEQSIRALIDTTRPDQVYHLAGISKTFGIPTEEYEQVNTLGTYNLGRAILDIYGGQTKLLFVSSSSVYGAAKKNGDPFKETDEVKPTSEYGVSKASAEMYLSVLQRKGLNCVTVRPFNHTGPGQQLGFVCPDIAHRLKESIKITKENETPVLQAGKLDSVRDFTDVRDVIVAYEQVMQHFDAGSIVNIASGVGVSVRQIIDILVHEVAELPDVKVDLFAEQIDRNNGDVIVGDASLLKLETGWHPSYSLKSTLKELWGKE